MDQFDPLTALAQVLGLDPLFLAGLVPFAILFFNLLGRAIPDDATGFLGFVRKVSKVLGLYLSNRVSTGISTNAVVQVAAGVKPVEAVPALLDKLDVSPDAAGMELQEAPKPLFPGVTRGPDGRFQKIQSSWLATLGAFIMLVLALGTLSACATMQNQASSYICKNREAVTLAIQVGVIKAQQITDPVQREAALSGFAITSAALSKCPPIQPGA